MYQQMKPLKMDSQKSFKISCLNVKDIQWQEVNQNRELYSYQIS